MNAQHVPNTLVKLVRQATPEAIDTALQAYYDSRGVDGAAAIVSPRLNSPKKQETRLSILHIAQQGVQALIGKQARNTSAEVE